MTYQPRRVQRKRTKGWRTPLCGCGCGKPARYVGRGSRWGNPARIITFDDGGAMVTAGINLVASLCADKETAAQEAARQYRWHINHEKQWALRFAAQELLAGHDLMCWCPPDQPCHADVLLEIANTPNRHEPVK